MAAALDRVDRTGARILLALIGLVGLWCALAPAPPSRVGTMKITDTALYAQVIAGVRDGRPYYPTVTALQRRYGAPLRPFVTVRLPTLAWIEAKLEPGATRGLAMLLLAANAFAWPLVLRQSGFNLIEQGCAGLLVLGGGMLVLLPALLVWHEIWAGLLVGLGLTTLGTRYWWTALILAAMALAIRELALPFVLLAALFAACDRKWSQLAAWLALLIAFAIGMVVHRGMVDANIIPTDPASPGWIALRGPAAVVDSFHDLTLLGAFPRPVAYGAALLPLIGWCTLPGIRGGFVPLFFGGYCLLLSLFARPDNYYWAHLMLPVWLAGLALVPRALGMLIRQASGNA